MKSILPAPVFIAPLSIIAPVDVTVSSWSLSAPAIVELRIILPPLMVVALLVAKFSCPVASSVNLRFVAVVPSVDSAITVPPIVKLVTMRLVSSSLVNLISLPAIRVRSLGCRLWCYHH